MKGDDDMSDMAWILSILLGLIGAIGLWGTALSERVLFHRTEQCRTR